MSTVGVSEFSPPTPPHSTALDTFCHSSLFFWNTRSLRVTGYVVCCACAVMMHSTRVHPEVKMVRLAADETRGHKKGDV